MRKQICLMAGIVMLVTACGGLDFFSSHSDAADANWVLASATDDGEPLEVLHGHDITLTLNSGRLNGRAACNSYSGRFALDEDGTFQIADGLAVNEMWCSDDDIMEAESRFLAGLDSIDRVVLDGDQLVATGGPIELRFDNSGIPLSPPSDNPDQPVSG